MLLWSQIILLLIISVISLSHAAQDQHKICIHDEIAETNPYKVNLASARGTPSKRQAPVEYSNIRIHPVFVNGTSALYSQLEAPDSPFFDAVKTLSSVLMVQPVQGNLIILPICTEYTGGDNEGKCTAPLPSQSNFKCGEFGIIPTEYIGTREVCPSASTPSNCFEQGPNGPGIPNTDYLLFVSAINTSHCSGSTLAYASTCMVYINDNNRPVAGYINVCPQAVRSYRRNIIYGIIMHEIIHALGFSSAMFDQYVYKNGTEYNPVRPQHGGPYGTENVFTGPKTVELAKKYYDCNNIGGLLLENEGGSGTASSHWEQRTLHHELMNGYIYNDYVVLSQFTIAALEDSGWYKGNYTALDELNQLPLEWGKGLGCSFLTQRCTNKTVYPYLCDVNTEHSICTYDHLSKGSCMSSWRGFDGCPVAVADDNSDYCRYDELSSFSPNIQFYGSNAICVDGARLRSSSCGTNITLPSPQCVLQTTYTVNNSNQYVLWWQDEIYSCKDGHALVISNRWIVSCPPTDGVISRTTVTTVSGRLPNVSPAVTVKLHNSIYHNEGNCTDDLIGNTDITFVLDTSGSISERSFQYVREFIEDFVLGMNIGPDNSRVAVILFNNNALLYFNLNAFTDKVSLIMSIRDLPYSGGGTNIPNALNLLRTAAQDGSLGIRSDNRQIAIFLTDGEGGDVVPAVAALAAANIFQVYSVGVDNARLDQLNLIAFNNSDFVYYHSDFTSTSLITIAEQIIKRLKDQFIILQPRLGSVLGGTLIQLIGNNIKFNNRATYTCTFDETEVDGIYFTQSKILCVSPLLSRIGRIEFTLSYSDSLIDTQKTVLVKDTFFSLPVQDSNVVESENLLLLPGNKTIIHWSPDSIVPPHLQETFTVTNDYHVDISLYLLNFTSRNFVFIEKLASDVPNTGIYEITVPLVNLSESFTIGIIGISLSEQFVSRSTRNVFTKNALGLLKRAPKFGLFYIGASLVARAICSLWRLSEAEDIGKTLLNRLPPCPPTRACAENDLGFKEESFLLFFFHPGASSCFRQTSFTSTNRGSGQQCCYSDNGMLLVGPEAGGTVDRYAPDQHFWKHQFFDVLPFIFCCKGLFSDCSAYYDRRPSDDGSDYDCSPPATVIGDPHIITLDGFQYTFNGKGEFILIDHVNGRFTLQGRMTDIREILPTSFNLAATVFSAVVGKQSDSDIVQFEMNQQRNGIDIIVSGEMINLYGLFQETFNKVTVFNLGNNTFAASFSSGCSIKVKEENGFISVFSVTVPSSFKGLTRGILGNYNGDTTDDLMARNSNQPLPHNSSIEVIHKEFGTTWFSSKSESLFTYNQQIDQSWESFYDPYFLPLFTINQNNELLESICENDTFCLYDISVTGNTEIGLSTLNGSKQYDKIVQLSYPVICDPPCIQGACVANDTCNCIAGYEGKQCTQPVYSECGVELCTNGGTCRKLGSSYSCVCPNGYVGLDCEIEVNECLINNGGCDHICTNTPGSFNCSCDTSYVLAPADNKTCFLKTTDCFYILMEPNGHINTSGFPVTPYAPNSTCTWIIFLPAYNSIELEFDEIDIEDSPDCAKDRVTILNGKEGESLSFGSYCGNRLPATFKSSTDIVTIKFVSDDTVNNRGFSLQYRGLTEQNKAVYDCNIVFSRATTFALSTFPSKYNGPIDCVYYFVPPRNRQRVKLTFLYLDIVSADCGTDKIEIYDGFRRSVLRREICNGNAMVEFISNKENVRMTYMGKSVRKYRGFLAVVTFL